MQEQPARFAQIFPITETLAIGSIHFPQPRTTNPRKPALFFTIRPTKKIFRQYLFRQG